MRALGTQLLKGERLARLVGKSNARLYVGKQMRLSRLNSQWPEYEGHQDMMEGVAARPGAGNAASKASTRRGNSSTVTRVRARNAGG